MVDTASGTYGSPAFKLGTGLGEVLFFVFPIQALRLPESERFATKTVASPAVSRRIPTSMQPKARRRSGSVHIELRTSRFTRTMVCIFAVVGSLAEEIGMRSLSAVRFVASVGTRRE